MNYRKILNYIWEKLGWFFIGGVAFASGLNSLPPQANIPVALQLKTDKTNILGNKQITVFDLDETDSPIKGTEKQAIKYAYKSNRLENKSTELVEKRTKHSRTFKIKEEKIDSTHKKITYKSEFISGVPQYYEDENEEWWQVDYATTTEEAFNQQTITKTDKILNLLGIEKVWATTSTFYPDASPESTSVDGRLTKDNGGSWAGNRDATDANGFNTDNASDGWALAGEGAAGVWRSHTGFDLSSIGTDNVDSAIFSRSVYDNLDEDNDADGYVAITSSNPATDNDLVSGDFDSFGDTELSDTQIDNNTATGSYDDYSLNSAGITYLENARDGDGIANFFSREGHDINNNVPAVGTTCGRKAYFADQTGTANDPKLVVVHSAVVEVGEDYFINFE